MGYSSWAELETTEQLTLSLQHHILSVIDTGIHTATFFGIKLTLKINENDA